MPIRFFVFSRDLYERIKRRAANLGLTPGAYLKNLAWRDVTGHAERKALRKMKK